MAKQYRSDVIDFAIRRLQTFSGMSLKKKLDALESSTEWILGCFGVSTTSEELEILLAEEETEVSSTILLAAKMLLNVRHLREKLKGSAGECLTFSNGDSRRFTRAKEGTELGRPVQFILIGDYNSVDEILRQCWRELLYLLCVCDFSDDMFSQSKPIVAMLAQQVETIDSKEIEQDRAIKNDYQPAVGSTCHDG